MAAASLALGLAEPRNELLQVIVAKLDQSLCGDFKDGHAYPIVVRLEVIKAIPPVQAQG